MDVTPKEFRYALTIAVLGPLTAAVWAFYLLSRFVM
jgi:hypothetical protein